MAAIAYVDFETEGKEYRATLHDDLTWTCPHSRTETLLTLAVTYGGPSAGVAAAAMSWEASKLLEGEPIVIKPEEPITDPNVVI